MNTRDELVDSVIKVLLFPNSHTGIYYRLDEAIPKREFCIARAQNVAEKIEAERQKACVQRAKEDELVLIKQWLYQYQLIKEGDTRIRIEELKACDRCQKQGGNCGHVESIFAR